MQSGEKSRLLVVWVGQLPMWGEVLMKADMENKKPGQTCCQGACMWLWKEPSQTDKKPASCQSSKFSEVQFVIFTLTVGNSLNWTEICHHMKCMKTSATGKQRGLKMTDRQNRGVVRSLAVLGTLTTYKYVKSFLRQQRNHLWNSTSKCFSSGNSEKLMDLMQIIFRVPKVF